jgi:microcystin-dependent protein
VGVEPYVGEIRLVGFTFPPMGWELCDGALLPIAGYQALFSIIGITYGGNGQTNFALPDLRGRRPAHIGQRDGVGYSPGQAGGAETHTLTAQELPAHTHTVRAGDAGGVAGLSGAVWAPAPGGYGEPGAAVLASGTVTPTGGGQPHDNLPPFLTVNFVIATEGIFPARD